MKGRKPIPSIAAMLEGLSAGCPEPGWTRVAYSLLSQITHATPLGYLHTIRAREHDWQGNTLSTEMLALSLDVACMSSAYMIGHSALVLSDLSEEAIAYRASLIRAAAKVHQAARLVHGLD
jgi:hypothetical protein